MAMDLFAGGGGTAVAVETYTPQEVDYRLAMRKLWQDYVIWMRLYFMGALANAEGTDKVADRLVTAQISIGDAFKPYYGHDAGELLSELLRQHVEIAMRYVAALKSGSRTKDIEQEWFNTIKRISLHLGDLNPNWTDRQLRRMLLDHGRLMRDEIRAHLRNVFAPDITTYDTAHEQILEFADTLALGVERHMPERFGR